jgi:thiosulfate sulfurtransferase
MSNFMEQEIAEFESHDGGLLIDLRDEADFDAGHIPGALHMTLENIRDEIRRLATFNTKILLYCYTGTWSRQAEEMLKAKGYENAINLGGIDQYSGRMEPAITVREMRRMKNLSQNDLARAIGIRQLTVAAYESGKANPGPVIAAQIRKQFNVTIAPMEKRRKKTGMRSRNMAGMNAIQLETADVNSVTTIRELRAAMGLTQAAAASALGVKPGTIAAYEAGRIHPSSEIIRKAHDLYGVSLKPGTSRRGRTPKKRNDDTKAAYASMFIQMPGGKTLTAADILEKVTGEVGEVESIYVRTDEGKAYWVKGEDGTGSVDL